MVGFPGKKIWIIKVPRKLVLFVWMDALSLGKIMKILKVREKGKIIVNRC